MAEREGFEPSIGVTYTPLAGARLQPLGHLSAAEESTERRDLREPESLQLPGMARFFGVSEGAAASLVGVPADRRHRHARSPDATDAPDRTRDRTLRRLQPLQ